MGAWGRYSPLRRMQLYKERKPQKLWLELLGKSYVGLIYWTVLVEFLRNVFWFQLRAGRVAPQLGFLAYLFIPSVVVGRPFFRQFLEKNPWSRALLVIGGVLGLWGQWYHSAVRRVTLSATGAGLLGIYVWEGMWAATTARRERTAFGMVGGILLLQVLKWAYAGPNPLVAKWWGLLFLGIIPGVFTALLVLSEDLAESEGGELQSFLEEDLDVELEEVTAQDPLPFRSVDSWKYSKLEVIIPADTAVNRENRWESLYTVDVAVSETSSNAVRYLNGGHVNGGENLSRWTDVPIDVAGKSGNEEKTAGRHSRGTSEEHGYQDIMWHDEELDPSTEEDTPKQNGAGTVKYEQEMEEITEVRSPKSSKDEILHKFTAWSGGFGVDAFREARTDSGLQEVLDSPVYREIKDESVVKVKPKVSPRNNSPTKDRRWGEGEEVPWLMDIQGNNDITDSELDPFRHKDTKWNISSCVRTAQRGIWSGSLLFITHWLLTAPTSFSRWEGTSVEHGWISILALALGLLAATEYPRIVCLRRTQGLVFWLLIALGGMLFTVYPESAMAGAALVAFSAPSLWISIAQFNLETYPGSGLGIMVLVYITFTLWSTCLVAYQSLPELSFLRGTRNVLMGCAVMGIGLGVGREALAAFKEKRERDMDLQRGINKTHSNSDSEIPGRQAVGALLGVVALIGLVAVLVRIRHSAPNFFPIGGGPLKVLNLNIQQGFSRAGTVNYDPVLHMLHQEQPHVVMLQESDTMHIVHGNIDTIDYLSVWLRMHSLYSPPTKSDTWGCAMLSFYPFIYSRSGVLVSPEGENSCFQYAQIKVGGKLVHLLNTHYGTLENDISLQAEELAVLVQNIFDTPENERVYMVMAGDINSEPLSPSYNATLSSGLLKDAYMNFNGGRAYRRDPGAGYIFSSSALNCTYFDEPYYDQEKTADGFPIVASFEFT
ncbi:hypothetical protein R1flu_007576 [Riccia fluitans]|uniref:Endonuclease/exonuclease/phosphatase domain-containing protein n=1 Tax=Riccia fluitans TaxID=41844 RepID=A0ABD1Z3G1_9MARC